MCSAYSILKKKYLKIKIVSNDHRVNVLELSILKLVLNENLKWSSQRTSDTHKIFSPSEE